MASPRFGPDEIWTKVSALRGKTIDSLTGRSFHRITSADPAEAEYEIEYPSGNRITVRLNDLYRLYSELYACGSLGNSYMKTHVKRILGWKTWDRPGSAIFAILPLLDDSIQNDGGDLNITSRELKSMLDLDAILETLERHRQRATFGAVAGLLSRDPYTLFDGYPRNQRTSWVVSKDTGLPTGQRPPDLHPDLKSSPHVISNTEELRQWLTTHP